MDEIGPNDNTSEKKYSTFECRVCLEPAVWPVVTACGHLYCWQCLSTWLIKGQKECPVCKSGCTEETITPIYSGEEQPTDHPKNQPRPRGRREEAPDRSTAGEWHSSFHLGSAFGFVPFLGFTYVSVQLLVKQRFGNQDEGHEPPTPEEARRQNLFRFFLALAIFILFSTINF